MSIDAKLLDRAHMSGDDVLIIADKHKTCMTHEGTGYTLVNESFGNITSVGETDRSVAPWLTVAYVMMEVADLDNEVYPQTCLAVMLLVICCLPFR